MKFERLVVNSRMTWKASLSFEFSIAAGRLSVLWLFLPLAGSNTVVIVQCRGRQAF